MSHEPTQTASSTVRPAGGTLNEAVRASILAVQASHRAARRRVLRDRIATAAAAALTITAVWGISRQFGSQSDAEPVSPTASESASNEMGSATAPDQTKQAQPATPEHEPPSAQVAVTPESQPLVAPAAEPEAEVEALVVPASAAPIATATFDPAIAVACDKALKRKHWLKIFTVCATAYEQGPSAPRALSVAQAYHRRGRIAEAGQWAERVLVLEPSHPEAFIILAHAAEQAEQKAKAKAAYRQYLALAPRGWHASEARQALGVIE